MVKVVSLEMLEEVIRGQKALLEVMSLEVLGAVTRRSESLAGSSKP